MLMNRGAKKKISFVIPVYNEHENIPELIKQLTRFMNGRKKSDFEVIFVENGSQDNSYDLLEKYAKKDNRLKILQLSRNFGCDGGITAGMQEVNSDSCVIMMADLQEPIEVVDSFIEKWKEGYKIVYGVVKKRTAGMMRNLSSVVFYKIINFFTQNMFPA